MKLIQRVGFYLGGFAIGLVLLFFFLSGKKTSCDYDYSANSRTLKNIRIKNRVYTENALMVLSQHKIDSATIEQILNEGDVLFSESNIKMDSCKQYVIEGFVSEKTVKIKVENCTETATIFDVSVEN